MNEKGYREFQVFAKPVGPRCNIECSYCYYLDKTGLFRNRSIFGMPDILLEEYIVQQIEATTGPLVTFSWHGGEPLLAGLETFRNIVAIQQKHRPQGKKILNGMQTNGTLLDEEWCRFLAREKFAVGISLDGTAHLHNRFRKDRSGHSTFDKTINGYRMLIKHGLTPEILCVVSSSNVTSPLEIYRFFRELGTDFITFLPLVERLTPSGTDVTQRSVPADAFGDFLCTVFNEWIAHDIGNIKVQVFEEALRCAFNQEHTLCIFKRICGGVPVVEHDGSYYSCDHYVDKDHYLGSILDLPLAKLLDHPLQKKFGRAKLDLLPAYCLDCEVRDMCNGECPKNRFIHSPDGEPGLNYLCTGYRRFFNHIRPFAEDVASLWHYRS